MRRVSIALVTVFALIALLVLVAALGGCAAGGSGDLYGPGPGKTLHFDYRLYELDRDTGQERPAGANYIWRVTVTAQTLAYQPLQVSPGKPFGLSGIAKTDATGLAKYEVLVRDNLGPCIVTVTAELFTGGGSWAMGDFNGPPGTRAIESTESGEVEVHETGGTIRIQYDIRVD